MSGEVFGVHTIEVEHPRAAEAIKFYVSSFGAVEIQLGDLNNVMRLFGLNTLVLETPAGSGPNL